MTWGRQEDAHEFLRYVIDAMQRSCLNGNNKYDLFDLFLVANQYLLILCNVFQTSYWRSALFSRKLPLFFVFHNHLDFPISRLDKYSKETTVVNQIFGGFLRSQGVLLLTVCVKSLVSAHLTYLTLW